MDEVDAVFHHAHYLSNLLHSGAGTIANDDRCEELSHLFR